MAQSLDLLEQFDAEWKLGGWSIGRSTGSASFTAYVHGHGACCMGAGDTPRAAFDSAVADFRSIYPDELTAKRQQLQRARDDAARLEAELEEQAA